MRLALEDIRVLDLGRFIAAPWAGTLLARMGAEVIRLESPGGENDRFVGLTALDNQSMTYHLANVSKKGITLDIRTEKGKEIFHELLGHIDILLENYSPGGAQAMGISYESIKQVKPDIIYVCATGFGLSGPYANRLAFDPAGKAMSGSMSITGFPGDPPTRDGSPWVDFITATNAAVGALAALHHRDLTGEGQLVEVSMVDSALAVACRVFMDYMVRDMVRTQLGNQSLLASQNVYKTKDGWMLIATIQAAWKRFCKLIDRLELADDLRFKDDVLRFENRSELDQIIQSWMGNKTTEELVKLLEKVRIPFAPVYDGPQVAADPHFRAREMILELEYPGGQFPGKTMAVPGMPIKLWKTPARKAMIAPQLGQHNGDVYCGLLGYSEHEVICLKDQGVI